MKAGGEFPDMSVESFIAYVCKKMGLSLKLEVDGLKIMSKLDALVSKVFQSPANGSNERRNSQPKVRGKRRLGED